MKYICVGYIEPGKFAGMTEDERHATLDECFEHNDHLRALDWCSSEDKYSGYLPPTDETATARRRG